MLRFRPGRASEAGSSVADMQKELQDTRLALAECYETQEQLQEQITELQLAMVEQYEQGGK